MRHEMVHQAKTPYVKRGDAEACLNLVIEVVETVDRAVANG